MNNNIEVLYKIPAPEEYNDLRKAAGLSLKGSYVSLIADVPADRLYKKLVFNIRILNLLVCIKSIEMIAFHFISLF